jgi:hypothetical protein
MKTKPLVKMREDLKRTTTVHLPTDLHDRLRRCIEEMHRISPGECSGDVDEAIIAALTDWLDVQEGCNEENAAPEAYARNAGANIIPFQIPH